MGVANAADRKVFYVRLKGTKKGETPQFIVRRASDKKVIGEGNELSGVIKELKPHSYEHEGKTVRGFKMTVIDGEETYLCGFSYTMFSRTILNRLATVEKPGRVRITTRGNDGDYPDIFLAMDEVNLKGRWKYKKMDELVDRSGENANYAKLDGAMDKLISDTLGPLFAAGFSKAMQVPAPAAPETSSSSTEEPFDEVLDQRDDVATEEDSAQVEPDKESGSSTNEAGEDVDPLPF